MESSGQEKRQEQILPPFPQGVRVRSNPHSFYAPYRVLSLRSRQLTTTATEVRRRLCFSSAMIRTVR